MAERGGLYRAVIHVILPQILSRCGILRYQPNIWLSGRLVDFMIVTAAEKSLY